jgi:hypothetical protein
MSWSIVRADNRCLEQRDTVRVVEWTFRHWTPFNGLTAGEASSPGYRHAIDPSSVHRMLSTFSRWETSSPYGKSDFVCCRSHVATGLCLVQDMLRAGRRSPSPRRPEPRHEPSRLPGLLCQSEIYCGLLRRQGVVLRHRELTGVRFRHHGVGPVGAHRSLATVTLVPNVGCGANLSGRRAFFPTGGTGR